MDSGQQQLAENQRIVIRVAHRTSRQESKFTVKGSTKVSKVVTSVCRSFGLEPSQWVSSRLMAGGGLIALSVQSEVVPYC